MLGFVVAILLGLLMFAGILFLRLSNSSDKPLPGPKPWPLLGNVNLLWGLKQPWTESLYKMVSDYCYKYREASFWVFNITTLKYVFLSKHEEIEMVFKNSNLFIKSYDFKVVSKYLGDGILTSEGQKWKTRRKIHNPYFASTSLRVLTPLLNETAKQVISYIRENGKSKYIDVNPMVRHFVVVAASKSFFDYTLGDTLIEKKIQEALHKADKLVCEKIIKPHYWVDWIHHMTRNGKQLLEYSSIAKQFTEQLISWRENLQDEVKSGLRRKTLLDGFIEAYKNNQVSREGVGEEMATVLIAAHDTTAFTLVMALSLLGNHSEAQLRIQEELKEVLGDQAVEEITTEQLNQLVYLESVIKETLRLYPPGVLVPRLATADFELNGYKLPRGSVVGIAQSGLSNNPNNFEEPQRFKPERFLDDNKNVMNLKNFFPFGCGPRGCIGQRFAMNEMKVLLAHILSNFNLKAETKTTDVTLEFNTTLRTLSDVKIMFC